MLMTKAGSEPAGKPSGVWGMSWRLNTLLVLMLRVGLGMIPVGDKGPLGEIEPLLARDARVGMEVLELYERACILGIISGPGEIPPGVVAGLPPRKAENGRFVGRRLMSSISIPSCIPKFMPSDIGW